MAHCNPQLKYTVSVPGVGRSSAGSIAGLQVGGKGLGSLVEGVVDGDAATMWLDIEAPTSDDIAALERVFAIDRDTVQRLHSGAAGEHVQPECAARGQALYLCWAEVAADDASTNEYLLRGGPVEMDVPSNDSTMVAGQGWTGGYVPVPPWMQPSATQVLSRLNLQRRTKVEPADIPDEPQWEDARRQRIQQTLGLIDKPVVASKARLHAALRRWGNEQWWREVDSADAQRGKHKPWWQDAGGADARRAARDPAWLAEQLAQGARELIGYRIVQVWARGSVLLTLHSHASSVIAGVAAELGAEPRLRSAEPLAVVQALVERWVHATAACLAVLEQHTDVMDADLTQPVHTRSLEAASWTPVIARCRKASLALLRRCQINEAVLEQLCGAARAIWGCNPAAHAASQLPPPMPAGRRLSVLDASAFNWAQQLGALRQQHERSVQARGLFKKAEQRLSRLHRILLDRQKLRLLSTQKQIHRYFRILVTVELVFLPIELWYNVDNLNGITTPGHLQPESASDEDFWLTVLGMLIWAVAAIIIYAAYVKFFERK
ncbi:hypothetical protein IWW50_000744 [Coemansia erecta]|nr:hypothetical protein IWW50_000744 [Coemansia erecta]